MSKRKSPGDDNEDRTQAPIKRSKVDTALAQLYEKLADEDEETRFEAASVLLTTYVATVDGDQARIIIKRLFCGLCSSRKAARPGFYIALVSALVGGHTRRSLVEVVPLPETIDILRVESEPEANTTGQDERDHHFGRLLGCKALIESHVLFARANEKEWTDVLELLCQLASKKPWLRQQCGWTLFSCLIDLKAAGLGSFAKEVMVKFQYHKLIRSPEGVALWLTIARLFPKLKFPSRLWPHDDPLSKKDSRILSNILKGDRVGQQDDSESQNSSVWTAQLNFTWDVILNHIYRHENQSQISFQEFWQEVVEDGLFQLSGSVERKHLGLLLWGKVIQGAPPRLVSETFTPRVISCFMYSLQQDRTYIKETAQMLSDVMRDVSISNPEKTPTIVIGLSTGSGLCDFDSATRTRVVEQLLECCELPEDTHLDHFFYDLITNASGSNKQGFKSTAIKTALNLQQRFVNHLVHKATGTASGAADRVPVFSRQLTALLVLGQNVKAMQSSSPDTTLIQLAREKLAFAFEAALKIGAQGQLLLGEFLLTTEDELKQRSKDQNYIAWTTAVWKCYRAHLRKWKSRHPKARMTEGDVTRFANEDQSITLLLGLVLLQVYEEDPEALSMLHETYETCCGQSNSDQVAADYEELIETVLHFAAKPSKFYRRISGLIFEGFAPRLSPEGLSSLTNIITTKETREGQQELFEHEEGSDDIEEAEDDDDGDQDSAIGDLDSDVEVVDIAADLELAEGSSSGAADGEDDDKDSDGDDSDSEGGTSASITEEDPESEEKGAAESELEKALAAALGTRKLTTKDIDVVGQADADADSDSDSDMSDSEMMELDTKLSEVFKNQANQSASQKNRREEIKSAKENMINFKNRVLDLLEVFLRTQCERLECLQLVIPIMQMSATTDSKQVANRGVELLKLYARKCKGNKAPRLEGHHREKEYVRAQLADLHLEISKPGISNALVGAGSQMNILLVRTLVRTGEDVKQITEMMRASETRIRREATDDPSRQRKVLEDFFSNFRDWLTTVQATT